MKPDKAPIFRRHILFLILSINIFVIQKTWCKFIWSVVLSDNPNYLTPESVQPEFNADQSGQVQVWFQASEKKFQVTWNLAWNPNLEQVTRIDLKLGSVYLKKWTWNASNQVTCFSCRLGESWPVPYLTHLFLKIIIVIVPLKCPGRRGNELK